MATPPRGSRSHTCASVDLIGFGGRGGEILRSSGLGSSSELNLADIVEKIYDELLVECD